MLNEPSTENRPRPIPESSSRTGGASLRNDSSRRAVPPSTRPVKTGAPSAQYSPRLERAVKGDREVSLRPVVDEQTDAEFDENSEFDAETDDSAGASPLGDDSALTQATAKEPGSVRAVAVDTGKELPEIRISTFGGRIFVTSDDTKALDEIEQLVETLTQNTSSRSRWTLFYLRSADATGDRHHVGKPVPGRFGDADGRQRIRNVWQLRPQLFVIRQQCHVRDRIEFARGNAAVADHSRCTG
jgi:hypothetical protein